MMNGINIFLLDDDKSFLQRMNRFLTDYLQENAPYHCQLYLYQDIAAMLTEAEKNPPRLLIADIELADSKNGISGAETLHTVVPDCSIIYLTNYLRYAPDVFETEPLYFVLKDQYQLNLPKAIGKFFEHVAKSNHLLHLSSNGKTVTINYDDILYCEHAGKYVSIFCTTENYSVRSTITDFLCKLPQDCFAMCHNSFIVNLAHVRSVSSRQVIMDNGFEINISRGYREDFRKAHRKWISSLL